LPRLKTLRREALFAGTVLLMQLLLAGCASAQDEGSTESIGSRATNGAIIVAVRDRSGQPLTSDALVHLYSSDGTPLGQMPLGKESEVTFRNVNPGNYFVEVEAPGYTKAHEDATMPIASDVRIQVYLQPETKPATIDLSKEGDVILAPKAKKELDEGLEALGKNDLDAARNHLERASELAPRNPDVLHALATLNVQLRDLPKADGLLRTELELYPKNVPAQLALGIVLTDEDKFTEASPQLEKALAQNPQSWEGRWALARCYYHQRKFELALTQSRQALEDSKGKAPEVAMVEAASLTALARYAESASVLRKFVEEHPNSLEASRAKRWLEYLKRAGKIA